MKKFLLFLLLVAPVAIAENFLLNFTDESHIQFDQTVWQQAAHTNNYGLFVHKKSLNTHELTLEMTSLVEFHKPGGFKFELFPVPVKRIYTYGIIECKNGVFNVLNSWYVDSSDKIVYTETHSLDSYIVDMTEQNTPRNDLFRMTCPNN